MSLFISGAAFTDPEILDVAKLAIFIASILAAAFGGGILALFSRPQEGQTQRTAALQVEPATMQP